MILPYKQNKNCKKEKTSFQTLCPAVIFQIIVLQTKLTKFVFLQIKLHIGEETLSHKLQQWITDHLMNKMNN